MWVGSNTLELNEATMISAIQYWLDNKVLNKDEFKPIVTGVKGSGSSIYTFRVELNDKKSGE